MSRYITTEVQVGLEEFDTDELLDELSYRTLSEKERRELFDIAEDNGIFDDIAEDNGIFDDIEKTNAESLFSPTLLGEQVYNALAELVKSKTELELLELFEKAK